MGLPRDLPAQVNTRDWWEDYFARYWDAYGGGAQTRHFMERLAANLPAGLTTWLESRPLRILDWGCAFGEGVDVLARRFPASEVTGLDFAAEAIRRARARYPDRTFVHSETGAIADRFDVIVTSNCLEHFEVPLTVMSEHLKSTDHLYVALVPYDEDPLHESHRVRLVEASFPESLGAFRRIHAAPIEVEPLYWPGRQLLVIYSRD